MVDRAAEAHELVVIGYGTTDVIRRIPVGDHPQRVRDGLVAREVLTRW